MAIFYLELNRTRETPNTLNIPPLFGLHEYYRYQNEGIYFYVFANSGESKPKLLQDETRLLFVHGNCPNVDFDNYTDLESLYGNFNFIFINKRERIAKIVKDFSNSFDTFYSQCDQAVIVTNNPLLIPKQDMGLDYLAISQCLLHSTGFFPLNYFFKEIKRGIPGSILNIDSHLLVNIEKRRPSLKIADYALFQNAFNDLVTKSINSSITGKLSVDLTGGYDTRLITACLLKNNADFISVVHGEDDGEVKFVQEIASKLNLKLTVLSINDHVNEILSDWKKYFFLAGGYYNLFETLKEGGRSSLRAKYSNYKVGGSMGEVLRDKWYVDRFHRSRLTEDTVSKVITEKLLDTDKAYMFCSREFINYLNEFKSIFKSNLNEHLQNTKNQALSQRYMNFVFTHYTQGWNGCLYNFHNNIVSVIAPYMDNQFYLSCLNVEERFRKNASGITKSITEFYPEFSKIKFITGQKCSEIKGLNLLRGIYNQVVLGKIRRKFAGYAQVKDYDHAKWLMILLNDEEFKSIVEQQDSEFNCIISNEKFKGLICKGLNHELHRAEYDFLWKLLSLKITLNWASS